MVKSEKELIRAMHSLELLVLSYRYLSIRVASGDCSVHISLSPYLIRYSTIVHNLILQINSRKRYIAHNSV